MIIEKTKLIDHIQFLKGKLLVETSVIATMFDNIYIIA